MSVLNINNILNETHIKSKKFGNYDIMFYNKSKINEFNDTTRNIRSVVVDNIEKKIVINSNEKN